MPQPPCVCGAFASMAPPVSGAEAVVFTNAGEVDFFEVLVSLRGKRQKAHMFVMRLMHSSRDFAWLYQARLAVGAQ